MCYIFNALGGAASVCCAQQGSEEFALLGKRNAGAALLISIGVH